MNINKEQIDKEQNTFQNNNTKKELNETIMLDENFEDFLKIIETYKLKKVARNCSNFYHDSKEKIFYKRKETTAEHIYSWLKLADYFLYSEKEFSALNQLKVYELFMYHDDVEIETEDTCISQTKIRENKDKNERGALPILANKYPEKLWDRLIKLDTEYRNMKTPESKFAHAIDKMDALVHEIQYPQDRGPKWFSEENVRKRFQPTFEYSPIFMKYFESMIIYLKTNNYF